jgi:hypothetical protein
MAHLSKKPLTGEFSKSSMLFLEDNGFRNIESIHHLSVWSNQYITLYIPHDTIILNYTTLFNIIYNAGVSKGLYEGSETVKHHAMKKT